jgi:hypothetical protein
VDHCWQEESHNNNSDISSSLLLRFLPFVCGGCSGIFCLENRSKYSHGCLEAVVTNERLKTDKHKSYPGSFKDCAEKELVAGRCPEFEKNFCYDTIISQILSVKAEKFKSLDDHHTEAY